MHIALSKLSGQLGADKLLCLLIPWFLLVDCINGALLQLYGNSYALAPLYKLTLLLLMAYSIARLQPKWLLAILLALLLLLAGPALHWPQFTMRWMIADIQLAVKALSPLLALAYLLLLQQRQPQQAAKLLHHSLYISAAVLLVNAVAGLAGLGFSAYQPLEGVAQSFLGIKGFFYSTNELSAVLLVIACGLLALSWQQNKVLYILLSGAALGLALMLLTKTGLFGIVMLVALIPLLMQDAVFWQRQRRVIAMLAFMLLLLCIVLLLNGEYLLKLLGVFDKLSFVYQQRGISGIVLSSRDYYAGRIWQTAADNYPDWQRLAGVGQGAVALHLKKHFAELDWFDLLIFHGIAGLLTFVLVFVLFIRHSWQQRISGIGRSLLLLNLLLLLVSSLAGHVISSGMVWLPWALCNALLLHASNTRLWSVNERYT